ncbi:MAG TPA: hypothetical protein VEA99_19050 [Gemmatimonadaceae bacterium]|nr:hypothetical protein [Gemmatimonadaceae bacterium]
MGMFFVFALIWPVLGVSGLAAAIYFARRHVRALEQRGADAGELAALRQRVLQLEEALEGTRQDVQRLEEANEFTSRLLASRTSAERGVP